MRTINETLWAAALLAAAIFLTGCGPKPDARPNSERPRSVQTTAATWPDPLLIVLAPQEGQGKTDEEIRRFQSQVRQGRNSDLALEQLGWAFVSKARESFDAGYYKLAEQCALAIEQSEPQSDAALLLRGHVLDSLHRFHEAETLARQLVERRGLAFDYGLLGDALMEQGKLNEAVVAYQQMMNLRPDLHAYARAAHMRWLKGDLDGAIEAMHLAVSAATPHDAESAAWVNTRLANYEFQTCQFTAASQACETALLFQSNYPPALLLQGKMLLAESKPIESINALKVAAQKNPLPEYQWWLADALREAGREREASAVEAQLRQRGAASDPRTFALFLATRHESPGVALRLARAELTLRGDGFTHDALAWALFANGDFAAAETEMNLALAEGTQDARLFLHAAMIASSAGRPGDALTWTAKASAISPTLLPSERKELQDLSSRLAISRASAALRPGKQNSTF